MRLHFEQWNVVIELVLAVWLEVFELAELQVGYETLDVESFFRADACEAPVGD